MDLRNMDITSINKQAKSWLYADMLEKPEEIGLYRQPKDGGLGLHHVQLRAMANLINCFLETACNPLPEESVPPSSPEMLCLGRGSREARHSNLF